MGRACAVAIGRDLKGKISPVLFVAAIGLAFANRWTPWGWGELRASAAPQVAQAS